MYATSSRAARAATAPRGTTAVNASNESKAWPFAPPFALMASSCAAVGRPLVCMMTRTRSFELDAESNSGATFEFRFWDFVAAAAALAGIAEKYMVERPRRIIRAVIRRNILFPSFFGSLDACPHLLEEREPL